MFRTALLFLTLISLTPNAVGQEITKEITVEVRRDGKPAPDATVQVLTSKYTMRKWVFTVSKPIKADSSGQVQITLDRSSSEAVYANDANGFTGGIPLYLDETGSRLRSLVIELFPPETLSGRFVDSLGNPVAGLEVEVEKVFRLKPVHESRDYPDAFRVNPTGNWKVTTDAEGRYTITGLPKGYHVYMRFNSAKFGGGSVRLTATETHETMLMDPGRLKLEIESEKGKVSPKRFSIYLYHAENSLRKPETPVFSGDINDWNELSESGPIVSDLYTVRISKDSESELYIDEKFFRSITIKPGEVTVLKVQTSRGARITGRVVEKGSGTPIKDAHIIIHTEENTEFESGNTDENGNYSILVKGGAKYLLAFGQKANKIGERYFLNPPFSTNHKLSSTSPSATVAPGGKHEFPTVELREALSVVGNVIDAEGKPITNAAKVYCPVQDFQMRSYQPKFTGNQFTYRGLPYDVPLTFRLRSGKAVNIPERIDPKLLNEPQTFRLSEAHGVKIVGSVLDGKKQGVAGAKVTLTWSYNIQDTESMSTSTRVEVVKTDAKGAYIFEGWWPKERYYITVEGEGFGKVGEDFNAWKVGEPGSTITFDPILVNPLTLNATGQVQHLDGTPVVGATVQTCGETPKPITATTDAEGRYTLKGLPEMTLFITVAKPGYRPTYVIHETSKLGPNLTLRRSTEPPAPAPVISEKFLAERKQTMIDILEMLWPKRAEHGYGGLFFADMQRLDPARAKAWAEAATGDEAANLKKRLQAEITDAELAKLAAEDVDEAIARIGKGYAAPDRLRKIAVMFMAKDKAVALRLIEEATILSRKLLAQDPMRLPFNLGECAALAYEAGNVAGAKKLFAEATELVDKIADVKNRDIARSWLAGSVGKVDLAAAKELLSKCEDPYSHNSSVSKILVHLAKTDSQAAIDNLKLLKTDRSRAHFTEKVLIAATIAEREPDNALKLVESIETTVDRVRGYMELARLFAPKDKTKAWGLIDKAFDLMERDPTPFGSFGSSGGLAGAAAQVAHQAKKIDYPDVHSLIARLLLMRSQEGTFTNNDRNKVVLALVLSPTDPLAGRALLGMMYNEEKLINFNQKVSLDRNILFVLAMTDPILCKKLVEAKLKTTLNSSTLSRTGIVEMLSGMSVTGREIESLSPYAGGMYRPLSEER